MKQSLTYWFLFLYLTAMVRPVAPLLEYLINKDYIAEFLCVNRDKPEMHCEGKCYLMERLKQQNEDKKNHLPKITMDDYPIGFVIIMSITIPNRSISSHLKVPAYKNGYNYNFLAENFHPPTVLS